MAKPFISYTEQIEKLQSDKKLNIENVAFAVESLRNISYYALIGGYMGFPVNWKEITMFRKI